jgi:hypothetical protein
MVSASDWRRIWRALAGATGRVGGNAALWMAPMLDVNEGDLKAGVAGGGRRSAGTSWRRRENLPVLGRPGFCSATREPWTEH